MKPLAPLLACLVAVSAARAAGADPAPGAIHACPDGRGSVVYQDEECDVAPPAKGSPPPAKAAPKPAKAAPKPKSTIPAAKRAPASPSKGIKPVIDPATFTSDPRWGSPERTLRTFVAAMKAGDRALARSCLTAEALDAFGPRVDALPAETLRATVEAYTGFVVEGDLGPYWSIRAIRGKDRPKWIFFARIEDGTWKISAI
jgi:hypothetical protein